MKNPKFKVLFAVLGLLLLFVSGIAIRRVVLNAQFALYSRTLPFTLESALEYRVIKTLFDSGELPDHDKAIQVPEGISVRETYTIGAEYVYALLAKAFPATWSLPDRVRWISVGWFCLGIPLMSLWLWWWLRSFWAAGIGGAYYAVSLASVMRSTGQELSHENFALPLLIAHLALNALAAFQARNRSSQSVSRKAGVFWPAALLSAVFLGCAIVAWDLIQFYVLLWAILGFVRFTAGGYFREPRRRAIWFLNLLALVAAGTMNPYLRAHAFVMSYAMLLAYGVGLGIMMEQCFIGNSNFGLRPLPPRAAGAKDSGKTRAFPKNLVHPRRKVAGVWRQNANCWVKLALVLIPLVLGILFFKTYEAAYGHFLELLWAKLRFLNQKPPDPALLTFSQRILWTRPLNSVNIQLTGLLFPVMIPLLFLTLLIILFNAYWRSDPEIIQLLFYSGVSLLAFILFMRFHVFFVIFGASLLGWAGCWAVSKRNIIRWIVFGGLLCGVGAEAAHVLYHPARWGNRPAYLRQQQELVRWIRDYTQGEPVLANFGLSAFLLTYGGCPIVLHPKFESPEIRNRVREYGEALFRTNEEQFRAWADQYGASYYVYARGEFSNVHPEWQMRYFVDTLHPPPDAAARLFEWKPKDARFFTYLWGNSKYRVFRIIRQYDERLAARCADEAQTELSRGHLDEAESKATLSLMYNPNDKRAMKILLHVRSLRDQGIK